jgi:hypothetical protein
MVQDIQLLFMVSLQQYAKGCCPKPGGFYSGAVNKL